jgi:hypothetical protein
MKKILVLFHLMVSAIFLYAQIPVKEGQKLKEAPGVLWYANPWLWFAGAALFVIIFLLLLRRATRNKADT